jgi:hypothetical protein
MTTAERLLIYSSLSNGMAAIWMLAYLGGLWVCVVNRRLSSWLMVVALGFVGLFGSVGLGRFASFYLDSMVAWAALLYIGANVLGCLSTVVLVFGLGATLVDLRRQLSRRLDPDYVRR